MSESSQPPFGGAQPSGGPPPHPEWVTPTPPWSAHGQPTSPGAGGWDPWSFPPPTGAYEPPTGAYEPQPAPTAQAWPPGAWPPPGGWQRPAPPPGPPPPRRNRSAVAVAVVAAVLSGLVGVAIGANLRTTSALGTASDAPLSTLAPSLSVPTTPAGPGTGTAPNTPPSGSSGAVGAGSAPSADQASAIAAKVQGGIVDIYTRLGYQNAAGAGTGMILSSSGQILTNNHVVDGATSIRVTLVATGRSYTAKVVGTDPSEDIAVVQLQGASGLSPIPLGDSSAVRAGDPVVAIGNAGGVGGAPSVVTGTVQAVDQSITASDGNGANAERLSGLIQINAPIEPGDSGGPLVNASARVIGIDTAASTGSRFEVAATQGFAIPIAHALSIAQQINSGNATATVHIGLPGFLGVGVLPAPNGSSSSSGALIDSVQPGSPAESAGLVAGDTITSINGQAVNSAEALTTLTRSHHPGERVTVGWTDRAGASHTTKVTLAVGPAD